MEGLKTCMRYIFILSAMTLIGVFMTDWFFTRQGDLLNDTLVGVMIGAPIGWFGAFVSYYTTEKITTIAKQENGDAEQPPTDTSARNHQSTL